MNTKELDNKIVEFKLRERALLEERRRARTPLLYNAEKHAMVNSLMESLYVKSLSIPTTGVDRYSQPGRCTGREDEEFLSEITVILSARELTGVYQGACSDIMLTVKLTAGFDDPAVREHEKIIMDELESIRYTIDLLIEEKRILKESSS